MHRSGTANSGCRKKVTAALIAAFLTASFGCTAMQPKKAKTAQVPTTMEEIPEVPTVPPKPPTAPTPPPDASTLKMRPRGEPVQARPGEVLGPIVTYFGAARADGMPVKPTSVGKDGVPTYTSQVGSGFILVVEAKPGTGNREVGRRVYAYTEEDPTLRGDLEIIANHDLGDGSPAVCDRMRPKIGGVPGVAPLTFDETPKVSAAINDFACRFETFTESDFSCTMNELESYAFVSSETTTQFCVIVARAYGFPEGTTELWVRLRDIDGNPGPIKKMRIFRPKEAAKPKQ